MMLRAAVALLCCAALCADAARVLMLVPCGGKSQKNVFYGLGRALHDSGHEVVLFNGFKPSSPVEGVKEVVPDELAEVLTDEKWPSQFEMRHRGPLAALGHFKTLFTECPRAALHSAELEQLLQQRFDVAVLGAFSYAVYFVPHKLNIPYILLTPVGYFPLMTSTVGNPTLPAINPIFTMGATDHMSFLQRVKSLVGHLIAQSLIKLVFAPYCDGLVAEKYGAGRFPSAVEIERNASLVFLSGTEVTDYAQPLLPNTVLVGATHCEQPKPLPADIQKFVGNSEFVFFSLGTVARPEDMSQAERSAIVDGLSRVPYKVLLKWNTTDRAGMPANVYPAKWLPQQDILGHAGCRLFISHGGFASLLEAQCHGVPALVMPVTGDQFYNAAKAQQMGGARILHWEDLSAESMARMVTETAGPAVRAAARARRELLLSRPLSSRALAVHWVEHVVRHGGAPHLRAVSADLYWWQLYSLDAALFLLALLYVGGRLLVLLCRSCCRLCCRRRTDSQPAVQPTPHASKSKKRAKKD